MTRAVTIPADEFEAAIGEMAGNFHHGGYLTRRAMGDPGAWRSRWLGRCVRRAQQARRKAIGEALIERRYAR